MKHKLLYCDNPWQYTTYSDKGKEKSPETHYGTISTDDLCKLDIQSITEKDSVCAMWVYTPMLEDALKVLNAWGYKYVTILFNWTKTTKDGTKPAFGLGYYSRQNTEICILGKRGKGLKVVNHGVRQQIISPLEQHSKKPEIVRDELVKLFGDVSRIELFGRPNASNFQGWVVLGNEFTGNDIVDDIKLEAQR